MFCVQNVEIHRNVKGGNGKKRKKPRKIWNYKAQNSVKMSIGMFCDRNLLGMSTKEMEKKFKENSESQISEYREKIRGQNLFKMSTGKVERKSRKIPNHKGQKSENKPKRMAAFCSESFPNLFGENGKKINFSLTGDLIDLSAFNVGKFFEIIFTLRP